jgi:hypothetical protein
MTLINTDGMTFIGPGSEWLWTALTGIVLAVTLIAISRQLRMQAHASAIEQVETFVRESTSEQMNRYELAVLVALRDQKDPADLPSAAAFQIGAFWETFATLAKAGHRDTQLLWHTDPTAAQIRWAWLAPYVQRLRAQSGRFETLTDFEWLAGVMAEMDRRAGMPPINSEWTASRVERAISFRQDLIRTMEATRIVTLAQPVAVTVTRPAPAE